MRMFADDTKIWSKINGLNDCVGLQADLHSYSFGQTMASQLQSKQMQGYAHRS